MDYPKKIFHWINNKESLAASEKYFKKYNPANGQAISDVARGNIKDVQMVLKAAENAFLNWANTSIADRAEILKKAANLLKERKQKIAKIIALESGKPKKYAVGEVEAAAKCGLFLTDQISHF